MAIPIPTILFPENKANLAYNDNIEIKIYFDIPVEVQPDATLTIRDFTTNQNMFIYDISNCEIKDKIFNFKTPKSDKLIVEHSYGIILSNGAFKDIESSDDTKLFNPDESIYFFKIVPAELVQQFSITSDIVQVVGNKLYIDFRKFLLKPNTTYILSIDKDAIISKYGLPIVDFPTIEFTTMK